MLTLTVPFYLRSQGERICVICEGDSPWKNSREAGEAILRAVHASTSKGQRERRSSQVFVHQGSFLQLLKVEAEPAGSLEHLEPKVPEGALPVGQKLPDRLRRKRGIT